MQDKLHSPDDRRSCRWSIFPLGLLVICFALVLTSCGGGGGGGGDSFAAVGAGVAEDLGRNAANIINSQSQNSVMVAVAVDSGSLATDTVVATLTDSAGHTASASASAIAGAGNVMVGPIDATPLNDGSIEITVVVQRNGQSSAAAFAGVVTKDALLPASPIALEIPASSTNLVNGVNLNNLANVAVTMSFPPEANPSDLVSVIVSDGTNFFETIQQNIVPGGQNIFTGINASSLVDGAVTITARSLDSADNVATFDVLGTKDTATPAISSTVVAAGTGNVQGIVNTQNVSSAQIDVFLDAAAIATDSVAVRITDGTTTQLTSTQPAPLGGGLLSFTGVDLSAFVDGPLTLTAVVGDASLNSVETTGTVAQKDTNIAVISAAFVLNGIFNNPSVINSSSAGSVSVLLSLDRAATVGDTASVVLGTSPNAIGPFSVTAVGGEMQLTVSGIDASTLPDGLIDVSASIIDASQNSSIAVGTQALKDTVAPAAAVSGVVAAGAQNPQGSINIATFASVEVAVTVLPDTDANRTVQVLLTDGSATVVSSAQTAPTAGGVVSFTGLNTTVLTDGPISVVLNVNDGANNGTQSFGPNATKDTQIAGPTSAFIAMTSINPAHWANRLSSANVAATVTVPMNFAPADTVELVISDGATSVLVGPTSTFGGAAAFTGINLSTLADGPLTLTATARDAAGNSFALVGSPANKDTVDPEAIAIARVPAGPNNAANQITAATANAVDVFLRYGPNAVSGNQVDVILGDGNLSTEKTIPGGGPAAQVTVHGIDASGLSDGLITVRTRVTEASGNSTVGAGTPATKDTSVLTPVSAQIQSSNGNNTHYISSTSQAATVVRVVMPASSTSQDVVSVRLVGGAAFVQSSSQSAPQGAGALFFTVDASALPDGPIAVYVATNDPGFTQSSGGPGVNPTPISGSDGRPLFLGTPAEKDTAIPTATPSRVYIPGTSLNPEGYINSGNVSAVGARVEFYAGAFGTDESIRFYIGSNGVPPLISPLPQLGTSATSYDFIVDCSSLVDGDINGQIEIFDAAGNILTHTFTGIARKDTTAPESIVDLHIYSGPNNAIDVVNLANVATARAYIDTPASINVGAAIHVSITDGTTRIFWPVGTVTSPGQREGLGSRNVSTLLDGTCYLEGYFEDASGNRSSVKRVPILKDTVAPLAPTSLSVAAGMNNAANVINGISDSSVTVQAVWPANAQSGDTATVTAAQGATSANFGINVQSSSATSATVNLSALTDGTVTLNVSIVDAAGNSAAFSGTSAFKDTLAPNAPTAAVVASGAFNAQDVINQATESAVVVDVTWVAADPTATYTVSFGAGFSHSFSSPAPGQTTSTTADTSVLADGTYSIVVDVVDTSGNTSQFTSSGSVLKDVTPPAAPTGLIVAMGASNAANVINAASESSVVVSATFGATSSASETADVSLYDAGSASVSHAITVTPSATTMATLDASSLVDGAIIVGIAISDLAGNVSVYTGTAATKDVVAPTLSVDRVTSPTYWTTQTITGSASAGATVEVTTGAGTYSGTAIAGDFFSVEATLATSTMQAVSVEAIDAAGNSSGVKTVASNMSSLAIVQSTLNPPMSFSADASPVMGLPTTGTVTSILESDVDQDGDVDLLLVGLGKLYTNDYISGFTDATMAAFGSATIPAVRGGSFADYDNDGDQDLIVVDSNGDLVLYECAVSMGVATYSDVSGAQGMTSYNNSALTAKSIGALDLYDDGYMDFYALGDAGSYNCLIVNERANGFQIFFPSFAAEPIANADVSHLVVADYNLDGFADVLWGDSVTGYSGQGQSGFSPLYPITNFGSLLAHPSAVTTAGFVFGDYDNDGDLDLLKPYAAGSNETMLYRQETGNTFTDVTSGANVNSFTAQVDSIFADLDQDGLLDFATVGGGSNELYRNLGVVAGQQQFSQIAAFLGNGYDVLTNAVSINAVDVDGDGDLDLLCSDGSNGVALFLNQLSSGATERWVNVTVAGLGTGGSTDAKDAIGTTVYLKDAATDQVLMIRQVSGAEGAGRMPSRSLHFGGLSPSRTYKAEAHFPTGDVESVTFDIPTDGHTITITQQ